MDNHAITMHDLNAICTVSELKNADQHLLVGIFKTGSVLTYLHVLSGENVGLETCAVKCAPDDFQKYITDQTSPDYWCKIFLAKLQQLRGSNL